MSFNQKLFRFRYKGSVSVTEYKNCVVIEHTFPTLIVLLT